MIDYTKYREIVETYLYDNFTECLIKYQNVALPDASPAEYVDIYDEIVETRNDVILGLLVFTIYTPKNIGTERSRQIASALSDLLDKREVGGLSFTTSELKNVPDTKESIYFKQQLVLNYFDEGAENIC
jgi:hypothetical protein